MPHIAVQFPSLPNLCPEPSALRADRQSGENTAVFALGPCYADSPHIVLVVLEPNTPPPSQYLASLPTYLAYVGAQGEVEACDKLACYQHKKDEAKQVVVGDTVLNGRALKVVVMVPVGESPEYARLLVAGYILKLQEANGGIQ